MLKYIFNKWSHTKYAVLYYIEYLILAMFVPPTYDIIVFSIMQLLATIFYYTLMIWLLGILKGWDKDE